MYLVHVDPPSKFLNSGWNWADRYFPRMIYYKKDAKILAQKAKENGGTNIRIEKVK